VEPPYSPSPIQRQRPVWMPHQHQAQASQKSYPRSSGWVFVQQTCFLSFSWSSFSKIPFSFSVCVCVCLRACVCVCVCVCVCLCVCVIIFLFTFLLMNVKNSFF
jgi:hypothetical protein